MIVENYVSFETAKLLKEKGFDVETRGYYPIKGDATGRLFANSSSEYDHNHSQVQISAPALQMAMKWLREEKHIFIELSVDTMIKGAFTWKLFEYPSLEIMPYDGWEYTYEEACEEAIRYCLENLV